MGENLKEIYIEGLVRNGMPVMEINRIAEEIEIAELEAECDWIDETELSD